MLPTDHHKPGRSRHEEFASAGVTLLILGLLSIGAAGSVSAQSKSVATTRIHTRDVVGTWHFDLRAVAEPHEIRLAETLIFNANGKGSWVMAPTNKEHKPWAHTFTWFVNNGVVVISLAGLKNVAKAAASKDTIYAALATDHKAVFLTTEPGRTERFDRGAAPAKR